jgi:hypothetical protein
VLPRMAVAAGGLRVAARGAVGWVCAVPDGAALGLPRRLRADAPVRTDELAQVFVR